jgi:F-box protein 21
MAIEEWSRLRNMEEVSLERALSAFDMFVLGDKQGDFDEVWPILSYYKIG